MCIYDILLYRFLSHSIRRYIVNDSKNRTSDDVLNEMRLFSPPSPEQLEKWKEKVVRIGEEMHHELAHIALIERAKITEYIVLKMEQNGLFNHEFYLQWEQQPTSPNEQQLFYEIIGHYDTPYAIWIMASGAGLMVYLLQMQRLPKKA